MNGEGSRPAQIGDKNTAPTTSAEADRRTAGQRSVNLIWESTQALIATAVTGAVIYSDISGRESSLLGNAFTLIIAIYFVRMNHTKTGGVQLDDRGR